MMMRLLTCLNNLIIEPCMEEGESYSTRSRKLAVISVSVLFSTAIFVGIPVPVIRTLYDPDAFIVTIILGVSIFIAIIFSAILPYVYLRRTKKLPDWIPDIQMWLTVPLTLSFSLFMHQGSVMNISICTIQIAIVLQIRGWKIFLLFGLLVNILHSLISDFKEEIPVLHETFYATQEQSVKWLFLWGANVAPVLFLALGLHAVVFEFMRRSDQAEAAIALNLAVAGKLRQYDTDGMSLLLDANKGKVDEKLLEAFTAIQHNLQEYRPHIPDYVIASTQEGAAAEEDETVLDEGSILDTNDQFMTSASSRLELAGRDANPANSFGNCPIEIPGRHHFPPNIPQGARRSSRFFPNESATNTLISNNSGSLMYSLGSKEDAPRELGGSTDVDEGGGGSGDEKKGGGVATGARYPITKVPRQRSVTLTSVSSGLGFSTATRRSSKTANSVTSTPDGTPRNGVVEPPIDSKPVSRKTSDCVPKRTDAVCSKQRHCFYGRATTVFVRFVSADCGSDGNKKDGLVHKGSATMAMNILSVCIDAASKHAKAHGGAMQYMQGCGLMVSFNAASRVATHESKACAFALALQASIDELPYQGVVVHVSIVTSNILSFFAGNSGQLMLTVLGGSMPVHTAIHHYLSRTLGRAGSCIILVGNIVTTIEMMFEHRLLGGVSFGDNEVERQQGQGNSGDAVSTADEYDPHSSITKPPSSVGGGRSSKRSGGLFATLYQLMRAKANSDHNEEWLYYAANKGDSDPVSVNNQLVQAALNGEDIELQLDRFNRSCEQSDTVLVKCVKERLDQWCRRGVPFEVTTTTTAMW